jgi:hypothetical protein
MIPTGSSAIRKLARNGLPGSGKPGGQGADKSQLAIAESRIVIALHSPNALIETGLRECSPEKSGDSAPFAAEQCVLRGPVSRANIATNGHTSRIWGYGAAELLCSQDLLAEWDSNPLVNCNERT